MTTFAHLGCRLSAAAVVLVSTLLVGAAPVAPNLSRTFTVQPGGMLVVDADRGPIQITTVTGQEVKIEVRRTVTGASGQKADEILAAHEVAFEQRSDRVEVRGRMTKQLNQWSWLGRSPNLEVEYTIVVPPEFNLDLRTSAGSISSTGIKGKVKARTSGGSLKFETVEGPFDGSTSAGSISVAKVTGPVVARTSGGSIEMGELGQGGDLHTSAGSVTLKVAHGKLTAHTSGGQIKAGELDGPAELQTSAGSITVDAARARVEAKTSGGSVTIGKANGAVLAATSAGSISVAFVAQPQEDSRLATSGGSIRVQIGEGVGFDVQAKASGGRISTDIPVSTTVAGQHNPRELKGKLNGGGKALELQASAGSIRIEKR